MKRIILIIALTFCACNEIQIPESHTAVETFKREVILDNSFPDSWIKKKKLIDELKKGPPYPINLKFYHPQKRIKKKRPRLDDSYPNSWRMNVIYGGMNNTKYRHYKLSFTDKKGKLRITDNCYQCELQHNNVCVYIYSYSDFSKLFRTIYMNVHIKPHKAWGREDPTEYDGYLAGSDVDAFYDSKMLIQYKIRYIIRPNHIVFNGNMMTMVTPEMEKELNAKERIYLLQVHD